MLAITTGLVVAGIAGVLFTVPLLAVLNSGTARCAMPPTRTSTPTTWTQLTQETGPDQPSLDRPPDLVADVLVNCLAIEVVPLPRRVSDTIHADPAGSHRVRSL